MKDNYMTMMDLLVENLYNVDTITKITKKMMTRCVVPFVESTTLKAKHYDISFLFDTSESTIKRIQLLIKEGNVRFGKASVKPNKVDALITLNLSKKDFSYDEYYKTLQHEVIHILDFIKSKGRQTKYGYTDIESKYKHEQEFNEKIHEIAIYLKKKGKKNIQYTGREQVLELAKKASPSIYFYDALVKYPELYQNLLKRLFREGLLVK